MALQLYSVRELLPTNFAGTLKEIGSLGYREVEAAGYFNRSVSEVKQAIHDAGLDLVSAHYPSG
ncbi:MAG: sugar phosphate isomerase/epimerase, partial [Edaphobacter sp.]